MKCDETVALIKSMMAETAPTIPVQGTSSKKAKKKKLPDEAPVLEAGMEEDPENSNYAALKAGTAETEEAE